MIYRIAWWVLRPVVLWPFRVRFHELSNVPKDGPIILAGNHISYLDPILICLALPRDVHFMAKVELYRNRAFGWLLGRLNAFPVTRGAADREAIATATAHLSDGRAVGIFPEGTRDRDGAAEGQGGVAFLAIRTGAMVVPVGIGGTERVRPKGVRTLRFPAVDVVFGEPLAVPDESAGSRRERVDAMTQTLMSRIDTVRSQAQSFRGGDR